MDPDIKKQPAIFKSELAGYLSQLRMISLYIVEV